VKDSDRGENHLTNIIERNSKILTYSTEPVVLTEVPHQRTKVTVNRSTLMRCQKCHLKIDLQFLTLNFITLVNLSDLYYYF